MHCQNRCPVASVRQSRRIMMLLARWCVSWVICLYCFSLPVLAAADGQHRSRLKVMALGDSITRGYSGRDSYRWPLWSLIRQAGFNVDFVGSIHPRGALDDEFDADHEGHGGFSTTDILKALPGWLAQNTPDVVLLHIGTNDVDRCQNIDETAKTTEQIIDVIQGHNPKVIILLAQIIPIDFDGYCPTGDSVDETVRKLNQRLGRIPTVEPGVIVVDLYSALDARADLRDALHPNERGFKKMAQGWFQALKPVLAP